MASKAVMRAVRVAQFGGPEVLKLERNVPVPEPSDTQVLIEVKAASINPVDTYLRSGTYGVKPPLPYTPGADLAGVVKGVGSKVTRFKKGDNVYAIKCLSGSYAEFAVAEEGLIGKLPATLTYKQGAGIGVACYSAFRALAIKGRDKFKKGNTVLVHGASGAVGVACVQIASAAGLKVIGTAGTAEGMELAKKEGAAHVFNHREAGYTDKIMEATGGEGPDLIIEMLANVNLDSDLNMIAKNGIIVVVGNRGPTEINARNLMTKNSILTGFSLILLKQEEFAEMHAGIGEGLTKGWMKPHIGKEYTLEQAGLAHDEVINNSGALGKRVFVL